RRRCSRRSAGGTRQRQDSDRRAADAFTRQRLLRRQGQSALRDDQASRRRRREGRWHFCESARSRHGHGGDRTETSAEKAGTEAEERERPNGPASTACAFFVDGTTLISGE